MTLTFKSTDAGAVVLNNAAGSLNAVFRACLPQAGWVEVFSSGTTSVWQAPGGSRQCLRVDDAQTFTSASCFAYLRGFRTMSDVNTGTGAFPSVAQLPNGIAIQRTNGSSASGPRPWILEVGQTGFHFWYEHDSTTAAGFVGTGNTHGWFWFGDPILERDAPTVAICAIIGRAASTTEMFGAHSSTVGRYLSAHPLTEQPLSTPFQIWANGISTTASDAIGANVAAAAIDPITNRVNTAHVNIYHDGSAGVGRNAVGRIPGVYALLCSPNRFDTWSLEDGSGRTFVALPTRTSAANSQGRMALETTPVQTW